MVKSRLCHTIGIYLDINKTFDRIWQDGLLYKIHAHFGVHGDVFLLLIDYFKNRKTSVKVRNAFSYEYDDDIGCHKGVF